MIVFTRGLLLIFILVFFGCDSSTYTNFKTQYKGTNVKYFLEPGARTIVFPVLAKPLTVLPPSLSSKQVEDIIHIHMRHIPLIPFEKFQEAVNDSGVENDLLDVLNNFYEKGVIQEKAMKKLTACSQYYEPKFFLLLKVERSELYRDVTKEYKVRLFISGKLFYIKKEEVVLSFVCAALAKNKNKTFLPSVTELVNANLNTIAKNLPYDPAKSILLEQRETW